MKNYSHAVNQELGDIRSRVPVTKQETSDKAKLTLIVGLVVMIVLFALSV